MGPFITGMDITGIMLIIFLVGIGIAEHIIGGMDTDIHMFGMEISLCHYNLIPRNFDFRGCWQLTANCVRL